jgi:Flp pilus assembly protein TadG
VAVEEGVVRVDKPAVARGCRRGAAAVEFALLLPVMMTLILGCVDFGRFAYYHIAVTNASRAGGVSAMMNNFTSTTKSTWSTNVATAAKAEMNSMTGYTAASLTVTTTTTQDANGLVRAKVNASYPFSTIVKWNWTGLGIPSSFNLQRQVEVRLIR